MKDIQKTWKPEKLLLPALLLFGKGEQRAVAIREKAIARSEGVVVDLTPTPTGESTDEEEQR